MDFDYNPHTLESTFFFRFNGMPNSSICACGSYRKAGIISSSAFTAGMVFASLVVECIPAFSSSGTIWYAGTY